MQYVFFATHMHTLISKIYVKYITFSVMNKKVCIIFLEILISKFYETKMQSLHFFKDYKSNICILDLFHLRDKYQ